MCPGPAVPASNGWKKGIAKIVLAVAPVGRDVGIGGVDVAFAQRIQNARRRPDAIPAMPKCLRVWQGGGRR